MKSQDLTITKIQELIQSVEDLIDEVQEITKTLNNEHISRSTGLDEE
jgi:hypothetical protein